MTVTPTPAPCDECDGRTKVGLEGFDAMCRRCLIAANAELAQSVQEAQTLAEGYRDGMLTFDSVDACDCGLPWEPDWDSTYAEKWETG